MLGGRQAADGGGWPQLVVPGGTELHTNWMSKARICLLAALVLWPGFASAATIGQGHDWRPLRSGAQALGISDEMVERILSAGVEVSCPGTVHQNGGILNGWFLGGDETSFYTNAHGVIDIGADRQANFIEPLDKCDVRSYRDLLKLGGKATSYALDLPANRNDMAVGSFTPQRDSPSQDRARLTLVRAIVGAQALALPNIDHLSFTQGQEVLMVSLQPPAMRMPVIQACHIEDINLREVGARPAFHRLRQWLWQFGRAVFPVRDPSNPSMLLPIALHEGCHEKIGLNTRPGARRTTRRSASCCAGASSSFPHHTGGVLEPLSELQKWIPLLRFGKTRQTNILGASRSESQSERERLWPLPI